MEDKKRGFGFKTLLLVAFVSIIAGIAFTARFDFTNPTTAQNFWKEPENTVKAVADAGQGVPRDFVDLAKRLSPTVVNISTTQVMKERPMMPFPEFKGPFDDFFGGDDFNKFFDNQQPHKEFKRQSLGSGFILNKEGYILTNQHVIENATEILVTLTSDKKEYKAKVVGQDQKLDIALIKIKADGDLPVATLGNSDDIQIGEWVLAIGNPFGLGGSVTAGIVSQKGRIIGAGPYDNFIQTDASINPGNSGGPLFNMKGEVVGLNTAIIAGGQGIGFATPINMAKEVILQLKEFGKVTRGWIGVSIQELTPELAESFGLKDSKGVLISSVTPGDPADKAGLRAGDIIVAFDGKSIAEISDLPRTVASTQPGKSVEVRVVRDGAEKTYFVKVGTKMDEEPVETTTEGEDKEGTPDKRLGLSVQPITPELARRLGISETEGVIVSSVKPESPSATAGLRRGDVIKEIDRKPIKNMRDYSRAVKDAEKHDVALFLIMRGNNTIYLVVKLKAQ
ncbi:MAG: DegQ family serine endoprotease [Deltaproteobacteria bacterium]|nr:DegQ family serine endoprotease [Deltaproteobacteria bacterium]